MIIRAAAIALALVIARPDALNAAPRQLVFSSSSEMHLYKAIAARGLVYMRRETPAAAIDAAPEGSAVLILADEYPAKRAQVPLELYARARSKRLRLYPVGLSLQFRRASCPPLGIALATDSDSQPV